MKLRSRMKQRKVRPTAKRRRVFRSLRTTAHLLMQLYCQSYKQLQTQIQIQMHTLRNLMRVQLTEGTQMPSRDEMLALDQTQSQMRLYRMTKLGRSPTSPWIYE